MVISRLDPRATLLVTLAFLVVIASADRYAVGALLPFLAFPLFVGLVGRVDPSRLGRALLVTAPFVLLLGAGNLLFDTAPREPWPGLVVPGGYLSFTSIVLRGALAVSALVLLGSLTAFPPLAAAAARLGAPRPLVTGLELLHRYLGVLAGEAAWRQRAFALRSSGRRPTIPEFGRLAGGILIGALDRGTRLHQAMLCRGGDGHSLPAPRLVWRWPDTAWLGGWLAFFVAARWLDLPLLLGRSVLGGAR